MRGILLLYMIWGANFYYYGNGTEKNVELAKYYLKAAADAGLKRAIEKMKGL